MTLRSLLALMVLSIASASAATTFANQTFSVASTNNPNVGTHFHTESDTSLFGPALSAEVGRFNNERIRGMAEFSLVGLALPTSATLSFEVLQPRGLFNGVNNFLFQGTINVFTYAGNNADNIGDYSVATTGTVGSFATTGLLAGSVLSFDVTSLLQTAINNGNSALGIRLQTAGGSSMGAIVFNNFELLTTVPSPPSAATATPEPGSMALMGVGLLALGFWGRRNLKAQTVGS